MSEEDVRYSLHLDGVDKMEAGLKGVKHHSDELDHSFEHLKESLIHLAEAYAVFEIGKESLKEFEEHKVAISELTQMYNNNSESIGLNIEELIELSEKMENLTGIDAEQAMAAERNLMKYKDLQVSYEELIPLAGDLSKAMGTDIAEAANTLGRALENPERAARLLMQAGVSPQQKAMFENLEKTGQAAKAQAYLIEILGDKYKGLAESAFNADPTAQLGIQVKQLKESFGELIERGLMAIMPYLKSLANTLKEIIHWTKEHAETIKTVLLVLSPLIVAFVAYQTAMKIAAIYTSIMEAAQIALNIAMEANPIGLIIAGIAALVVAIYEAYQHFETFRRIVNTVWEGLKTLGMSIYHYAIFPFQTLYHTVAAVWDVLTGDFTGAKNHMKDIATDALDGFNDLKDGIENVKKAWNADYSKPEEKKNAIETVGEKSKSKGGKIGDSLMPDNRSDKVTGTKQVIINVSINKLVELIKIQAATIKEGANSAGEDVAKALLASVNQFSASADI